MLELIFLVLYAVDLGVTVVVATGNFSTESYPATLPDVIAVGGVAVDATDAFRVWGGTTSFRSTRYRGRRVPDICAIASEGMLPMPASLAGTQFGWDLGDAATSGATPQVAGVVALLLQKDPALTPDQIRQTLISTAKDIKVGITATGDQAQPGMPDDATGGGLVDALEAWKQV
jgi:subtilisin family serine protease